MADELLELPGRGPPATLEFDAGEGGKLFPGKAEQLEPGTSALDGDPLLSGGGETNGCTGELTNDLNQLARGQA